MSKTTVNYFISNFFNQVQRLHRDPVGTVMTTYHKVEYLSGKDGGFESWVGT